MVIQLKKEVIASEHNKCTFSCGIDDGSSYTGLSIVQVCKNYNKVIFKGTIYNRKDVKVLMNRRKHHRRFRRYNKRYRPKRFDNRSSSLKKGRLMPTILQKKEATLRVINSLLKYVNMTIFYLENVVINVNGENLCKLNVSSRKSIILRDKQCMLCGKSSGPFHVHHILPVRYNGSNEASNKITLCKKCHCEIKGREGQFANKLQALIGGKSTNHTNAVHVMQGKTYLKKELRKLGNLFITSGRFTANKRGKLKIDKSHSNDAIIITNLLINKKDCNIKDWIIKPLRKKHNKPIIIREYCGFRHRDLVKYTKKNGDFYIGYISAFFPKTKECTIITPEKTLIKYGVKSCKLLCRYKNILWY